MVKWFVNLILKQITFIVKLSMSFPLPAALLFWGQIYKQKFVTFKLLFNILKLFTWDFLKLMICFLWKLGVICPKGFVTFCVWPEDANHSLWAIIFFLMHFPFSASVKLLYKLLCKWFGLYSSLKIQFFCLFTSFCHHQRKCFYSLSIAFPMEPMQIKIWSICSFCIL